MTLDAAGSPVFTILPDVAYDHIAPAAEAEAAIARADCLCFGTLVQRSPVSAATLHRLLSRYHGRIRLLDLNLRRDCWTPESVRSSIERADVLKLNDDEAAVVAPFYGLADVPLHEFPARLLAGTRLSHVVVTLGARRRVRRRADRRVGVRARARGRRWSTPSARATRSARASRTGCSRAGRLRDAWRTATRSEPSWPGSAGPPAR